MKTRQITFTNLFKSIVITLLATFLVSCGDTVETVDETSNINSEQLIAKVTMFPAGYFDSGYVENYVITGVDDYGRKYSGTFEVKTGVKDVFNGVEAIPVVSTLSYSTTINNVQLPPMSIVLTQYYSAGLPRQYLGNVNDNTSVIMTMQAQASDIPATVISSSSGTLADLVGSNSSFEIINWSVLPNDSDTYNMVFNFNDTDSAGGVINNEMQTFAISSTGERLSWSMVSEIPSLNNTLKFSGNRI